MKNKMYIGVVGLVMLVACSSGSRVEHLEETPKVTSYKAKYIETFFENGKENIKMEGEFYYCKPNLTRREFKLYGSNDPENVTLVINNEDSEWTYNKKIDLFPRKNKSKEKKAFLEKYGISPEYITKDNMKYIGKEKYKGEDVYRFSAKASEKYLEAKPYDPSKIKLLVGVTDGIPYLLEYYDSNGKVMDRQEYEILNRNEKCDLRLFEFTPPSGIETKKNQTN